MNGHRSILKAELTAIRKGEAESARGEYVGKSYRRLPRTVSGGSVKQALPVVVARKRVVWTETNRKVSRRVSTRHARVRARHQFLRAAHHFLKERRVRA